MIRATPGSRFTWAVHWEWKFPLTVWFISSLLIQAWGTLIWSLRLINPENMSSRYFGVAPITVGLHGAILGIWQRWDAIHYQRIAQSGYTNEVLSAFFPLYPLLGRLVASITHTHVLVGLLVVANLAYAGSLILLYRLTAEWFDPDLAHYTTVFLALFPYAYFLHAPYTEAPALALITAALYAARRRRWITAGLIGLFAGLVRASVFPLVGALLWIAWEDRKRLPYSRQILHCALAAAPIVGNGLFILWRMVQGFPPLQQTMQKYWMRSLAPPWEVVVEVFKAYRAQELALDFWFNIITLLIVAALNLWGWKLLPPALRIFQVSLIGFFLLNSVPHAPLQSFGRYTLILFPNYILLAAWAKTPARRLAAVGGLGFLQLMLAGMFFMWWFTG